MSEAHDPVEQKLDEALSVLFDVAKFAWQHSSWSLDNIRIGIRERYEEQFRKDIGKVLGQDASRYLVLNDGKTRLQADVALTVHVEWEDFILGDGYGKVVDLARLCEQVYGKSIECLPEYNGATVTYEVGLPRSWSDAHTKAHNERIEEILSTGSFEQYNIRTILDDLYFRDIIPAGRYSVRCSW